MIPKTREAKSGEEGPEQGSIAELRLGIEAILSALREQWLWERKSSLPALVSSFAESYERSRMPRLAFPKIFVEHGRHHPHERSRLLWYLDPAALDRCKPLFDALFEPLRAAVPRGCPGWHRTAVVRWAPASNIMSKLCRVRFGHLDSISRRP